MKIRSLTLFDNPGNPIRVENLTKAGKFVEQAKGIFETSGYEVQTIRIATPPFPLFLHELKSDRVLSYAQQLERSIKSLGFDYLSLGPAIPSDPESYALIPDLIQITESTFCSGLMTDPDRGISLQSVRSCGEIIHKLAPQKLDGFANLFFAALGNVPPGTPYFPAAYHQGEKPVFSIAVEAADLAIKSFSGASSFQEARDRLVSKIEQHGKKLKLLSQELEENSQTSFTGIDFSLAPFPKTDLSIGTALESLGVKPLGDHGSLAAVAFLADTIDQADFPRTGFSGLFFPLMEDAILADRAANGHLLLMDLLLFSAVCGTGLDTIPLPGDVSSDQLSAILFDLAALSIRLSKPLTARLMPIPGKKAGDLTNFDFQYFAKSKILGVRSNQLTNLFSGDGYLDLNPRR
jgi:hypothetical protein